MKYISLLLFVLGSGSAVTLSEILSPTNITKEAACDDGYRISAMPRSNDAEKAAFAAAYDAADIGRYLKDKRSNAPKDDLDATINAIYEYIAIQNASATIFNICASSATKLESKPDISKLTPNTYIYLGGKTTDLKYPKDWNVALALIDENGNELRRFQPESSKKSSLDYWDNSCSATLGCYWSGENFYTFQLGEVDSKTAKLRVIFTRGKGIEQKDYTSEDFTKNLLSNPKAP